MNHFSGVFSRLGRLLLPRTYIHRARYEWYLRRFDMNAVAAEESAKFAASGLDREQAYRELAAHLHALGLTEWQSTPGMASIHWVLFAALAHELPMRRILEIGTFDGQTTALLARLFPHAEIVTLDLPPNDPILQATYDRGSAGGLAEYEARLARNTAAKNIKVRRVNSFFLPAVVDEKFDMIWVDGGHLYPEIAWDLCNAYHLLEQDGILLCDDVVLDPAGHRDAYVSHDSSVILQYIARRTGDPLTHFLKRYAPEFSADPLRRKYVSFLRKRATTIPGYGPRPGDFLQTRKA